MDGIDAMFALLISDKTINSTYQYSSYIGDQDWQARLGPSEIPVCSSARPPDNAVL